MNQIFVSDLDGTLLDSSGKLPRQTFEELKRLLEVGLPFTVATARSILSMSHLLDGLPLWLPVIELNGAHLSDYQTGEHLVTRGMSSGVARELFDHGRAAGAPPYMVSFDGQCDRLYYSPATNPGMKWFMSERRNYDDQRLREVDQQDHDIFGEQIVSMTYIGPKETIEPIYDWIRIDMANHVTPDLYENSYQRGWWWLTVHSRHASKAQALRSLGEMYDVPMSSITVFGDNNNDIPMFHVAGKAIAVENAVPALKKHADQVIGTNDEQSVLSYLKRAWPRVSR